MAIAELHCDWASGDDVTGDGSSGSPYKSIEYLVANESHDGTNGTRINVQSDSDQELTASIDLDSWGPPSAGAQLSVEGYDSVAGDGGIAGIDGGAGNFEIMKYATSTNYRYIRWANLRLHNTGTDHVIHCYHSQTFYNCEFYNTSGYGLYASSGSHAFNCKFHNIGTWAARYTSMYNCIVENSGANTMTVGCYPVTGQTIANCIFDWQHANTGTAISIASGARTALVMNNILFASGAAGIGISFGGPMGYLVNNYVEGFSGAGGDGFMLGSGVEGVVCAGNRYYNNTTNWSDSSDGWSYQGNNSALTASGLVDPTNGDFTPTADLVGAGWPSSFYGASGDFTNYPNIGAVTREEPAGGGRRPRIRPHGV